MASEGLGEIFEGDFADTFVKKFPLMLIGGPNRGSSMRRPGSDDPPRREWKFIDVVFQLKRH